MSHHMCVYFCSSNYNGVGSLFSFLRLLRQNVPSEDRTASKQLLRHLRRRKSQNFVLFSLCMRWPLWKREGDLPTGALPTSFGWICIWKQVDDTKHLHEGICLVLHLLQPDNPPHAECSFGETDSNILFFKK